MATMLVLLSEGCCENRMMHMVVLKLCRVTQMSPIPLMSPPPRALHPRGRAVVLRLCRVPVRPSLGSTVAGLFQQQNCGVSSLRSQHQRGALGPCLDAH